MSKILKLSVLFIFTAITLVISGCGGGGGGSAGNPSADPLFNAVYVATFSHADISNSFSNTIDIASTGDIFINYHPISGNSPPPTVAKITHSLIYQGTLQDDGEDINAQNIVIDANDKLHIEYVALFVANYCVYDTNGLRESCSSYFDSGNVYLLSARNMDSSGNHYIIPLSGAGTDAGGRDLFVWKITPDFTGRLATLEKNEMLGMLPYTPEDDKFTLQDISIADDGRIFICVDLDGAENNDKDGLLILNADMEKLNYFGENWLFNFPSAVDFDTSGNIYVSSTYGNEVLVFNSNMQKIGMIKWSDIPGLSEEDDFMPTDIRIKNDKLYIFNSKEDSGTFYIFEI